MKTCVGFFLLGFCAGALLASESAREPKIIGGLTAGTTQFPWVVEIRAIRSQLDVVGRKWCAGSILSVNWIITAAHCARLLTNRYRIIAGNIDLFVPNVLTIQTRAVTTTTIHPNYNAMIRDNDIALMRVFPAFVFDNSTVGSIPYAHFNFILNGTGTIAGWGARDATDYLGPRYLQYGPVTLLQNSACQPLRNDTTILSSQICGTGTSSTPCYGDDGGPLMCNRSGVQILCGIIAETTGCARGSPPKIFTRTTIFYDWIQVGTTL